MQYTLLPSYRNDRMHEGMLERTTRSREERNAFVSPGQFRLAVRFKSRQTTCWKTEYRTSKYSIYRLTVVELQGNPNLPEYQMISNALVF